MFQTSDDTLKTIEFDQITKQVKRYLNGPLRNSEFKPEFISNFDDLKYAHAQINELISLIKLNNHFPISEYDSIEQILVKVKPLNSRLNGAEYLIIVKQLEQIQLLIKISTQNEIKTPLFDLLCQRFQVDSTIIKSIRKTVEDSGEIADNASRDLKQIRNKILSIDSKLRSTTKNLASKKYKSYLIDSETTVRNGRIVLSVKSEHVNEIDGLIVDHSSTGSTVYIEPNESLKLSADYQRLIIDEQKEIDRILKTLTDQIRPHISDIIENETALNELDLIHAKAVYAVTNNACFPKINTVDYQTILKNAFHPILLQKLQKDDIQALDIHYGDVDSRIVLISGPNAGGKTVAIKTIGLLQLMFQAAIPIPCDERSSLPIFRQFYCDIGDKQSILNDLSTFSSHITHINDIIRGASVDTLVLIDELGTGTDPKEGAALSQAILNRFLSLGTKVIATSHLGDLKLFANNSSSILNASMQFDQEQLKSTFKLQMGIPGQSNAFEIAERLGIDKIIVDEGRSFMDESELKLENLISELNQKLKKTEALELELNDRLVITQKTELEYRKKIDSLTKFENEKRQEAIYQAEILLRDVNKTIENSVQRIRENQANRETVKAVKDQLKEIKLRVEKEKKQKPAKRNTEKMNVGDQVRHSDYSTIGEIIAINGRRFQVQIGHFKMIAHRDDLKLIKAKTDIQKQQYANSDYSNVKTHVTNELDLRGLNFDEAWQKCDEYLEYASNSGWEIVSLIHGKGTGVLRQKINEQLKHDKRIVSKRFGKAGEGDMGVTIVSLKK